MKTIHELYNEYILKGMSEDDAYTEAYSVICNRDHDENYDANYMEANL